MASSTQAGAFALQAGERPISIRRFAGYVALAGLVNAFIAAFLLCRLPPSHAPTLTALFVRAAIYVFVTALAGLAGARFYWNRSETPFATDPPLSFPLFALANAAGWVWVPSVVLLSRQDSPASPALAALGAAILATGLRKAIPSHRQQNSSAIKFEEGELFADSLLTHRQEAHGYIVALCIYAAAWSLISRYYLNAGFPLALGAFLFAWKLTLEPGEAPDSGKNKTRAALRLAIVMLPAILATLFALLYGIEHRNQVAAVNQALAAGNGQNGGSNQKPQHPGQNLGISGYESIILWPVPQKKEIVAPRPPRTSPLAPGTTKPLIIRFDGPYWYFQAPGKRPGPRAHTAHGSPVAINIQANNFIPLTMEAHQSLGAAIRLARCREIQVAIENRDNQPGAIALGVLLTDSALPGKPALYLGQQSVLSSEPGRFSVKSSAANEVLRFPIPDRAKIRKFDEITVMFFPDVQHFDAGPKIAIQQFELLPR